MALAHDDIPILSVEIINTQDGAVLRALVKEVEATNPGAVRVSIWSAHDYSYPVSVVPAFRVRFSANCTAKVAQLQDFRNLAFVPADAVAGGIGTGTVASTGATPVTTAENAY